MTPPSRSVTALSLMAPFRVARLSGRKTQVVDLQPDAALRQKIAEMLGLVSLRKFRFQAELRPMRRADWELVGRLGATVVQPCAVTLAPVTTRIDEPVIRRFLADMPEPEESELEMPEDDSMEPLGDDIDISAIALEALVLATPAFPRADDAQLSDSGHVESAPPGADPIRQEASRPFAGLADLKDQLVQGSKPARKSDE